MTLSKIKKVGTFSNDADSNEVVARAKHVNPIIDKVNSFTDGTATDLAVTTLTMGGAIVGNQVNLEAGSNKHLTAAESGKVIYVTANAEAAAYVLPTPAIGLTYKFILGITRTYPITIVTDDTTDTTGTMLRGGVLVCSAAAVNTFVTATSDINTMTIDDDVANCAGGIGSWVEVTCISSKIWFVTGVLKSVNSATSNGSAVFSDTDA